MFTSRTVQMIQPSGAVWLKENSSNMKLLITRCVETLLLSFSNTFSTSTSELLDCVSLVWFLAKPKCKNDRVDTKLFF